MTYQETIYRFRIIRYTNFDAAVEALYGPDEGDLFASFQNKKDADEMVAELSARQRKSKFRCYTFEVVDAGEDMTVERTAW